MSLLTSSDYPAIRALVDTGLTISQLPDSIIALDVFVGAGERWVLLRDPAAETRTDADLARARTAAMLYTASLLVPTALQRVQADYQEFNGGETVRYQANLKLGDRAAQLRALAEAELDGYLNTDTDPVGAAEIPTLFALACGRRGR